MKFVNYGKEKGFNSNFYEVLNFLKQYGGTGLNENWHWGRWEWLIGHPNLEDDMLPMIGMWKDEDGIVALATHDMRRGEAYIIRKPGCNDILPEVLLYIEENISNDGRIKIAVNNNDIELRKLVVHNDYTELEQVESILSLDCSKDILKYDLPDGYRITSYDIEQDDNKHSLVIFKGFEDDGEPPYYDEDNIKIHKPHFDPCLTVFVLSPNDEYVAHCGMWYDKETKQAYIEPVVTIPSHRRLGLGKAAVYECINRCKLQGAEVALVISNQQFYYRCLFEKSSIFKFWAKTISK